MTTTLLLGAAAGAALGAVYFALLWHSTRVLAARGRPVLFLMSAAARLAAMLGGLALYLHLGGGLPLLCAATLGFAATRIAATRLAARGAGGNPPCR